MLVNDLQHFIHKEVNNTRSSLVPTVQIVLIINNRNT